MIRALRKELVLVSFSEDLGKLHSRIGRVGAKNEGGVGLQEVADELEVLLSLLLVVMEWQQAEPVLDKVLLQVRLTHDEGGLELDDLADTGDGVVTSMVVLRLLDLLVLDLRGHVVLN